MLPFSLSTVNGWLLFKTPQKSSNAKQAAFRASRKPSANSTHIHIMYNALNTIQKTLMVFKMTLCAVMTKLLLKSCKKICVGIVQFKSMQDKKEKKTDVVCIQMTRND